MSTFQSPYQKAFMVCMLWGKTFYFVNSVGQIYLRKFLGSFSHIIESEIISFKQLESISCYFNESTYLKICIDNISLLTTFFLSHSLQVFTTPITGIFICVLVHLYCVISTEKWYNKFTNVIFFAFRNHSRFKSKNKLIIGKYFCYIFLWGFGLQRINTS